MKTAVTIVSQAGMALYCTALLKLYLDLFLVQKGRGKGMVCWLFFFMWQFCVNMRTVFFLPEINLTVLLVLALAVGLLSYEGGYWKRCVFPVAFSLVWMLLEGIVQSVYMCMLGNVAPFIVISICSKALLLLFVLAIRGTVRRNGGGRIPYNGSPYIIALLLLVMVLYNAFYVLSVDGADKEETGWLLAATMVLIVLIFSFYPAYLKLVEMVLERQKMGFYRKQLELYKKEWKLEEAAAAEIREMHHNMKQEYRYLWELAKTKQQEKLVETLEKLTGESVEKGHLASKTGNLVTDALLNHLWEQARQKDIALYTDLKVPQSMEILDEDLCILLGNAIDNAVEASTYVETGRREIWIQMTYEKGYLYISLKNRYQGSVKRDKKNRIMSRKTEKHHGLGIGSMEKVAGIYHGQIKTDWDGEIFTLNANLYECK